jgi:hypothetical protein
MLDLELEPEVATSWPYLSIESLVLRQIPYALQRPENFTRWLIGNKTFPSGKYALGDEPTEALITHTYTLSKAPAKCRRPTGFYCKTL